MNERDELEFLRKKVPELEENLNDGSSQNIPEFKLHFVRLDPPIEIIVETESESDEDSDDDDYTDSNFVLPEITETLTVEEALKKSESNPSKNSISGEVYGRYNKRSSFNPTYVQKSKNVCDRLEKKLTGHWMFDKIKQEDKKTLVETMCEENYQNGDIIIKENDSGN